MIRKLFCYGWYLSLCVILMTGCTNSPDGQIENLKNLSTQEILETFSDFETAMLPEAAIVLVERPQDAHLSAPVLAQALQFPRRDSYEAGIALVQLGEAAFPAIPYLIPALTHDTPYVREYAAFAFGSIGQKSKCAIPAIAPLLWDDDSFVRAAAAGAIDSIMGLDLVNNYYQSDPATPRSIYPDSPEGFLTRDARKWWLGKGQEIDWLSNRSYCNMP